MTAKMTDAAKDRLRSVCSKTSIRIWKVVVSHRAGIGHKGDYGRMSKEELIQWVAKQDSKRLSGLMSCYMHELLLSLGLPTSTTVADMAFTLRKHLMVIDETEDELDQAKARLHTTIANVFDNKPNYAQNLIALSNN